MADLFLILIPILITDVINPVIFAGTLYVLGTCHPIRNTLIMLFSFAVTYFLAGIVIAVGLDTFSEVLEFPQGFDYLLEIIVGVVLIFFGCKNYKDDYTPPDEKIQKNKAMTIAQSLLLGLQVNLIGLPFAIPYLGAIDQILKANTPVIPTLLILLAYNILYVLPFVAMVLIFLISKEKSQVIFRRINVWINKIADKYLPIVFVILGVLLLIDGALYFL
jgi:cytochrome c biogenesis protein CcdA